MSAVDTRPRTAVQLQLNGMGDLVWHAQYLRCVAEQSQGGQISLIAAPTTMAREIIGHEPWLREVIDFDRRPRKSERRRGRHSGLDGLWRFGAELAPKRFERMVLFSDHPGRAIMVCWRAGIRTILGFGDTWLQRLLLTKSPWIQRYRGPAVAGYKDATAFAIAQGFCSAPIVPRISVRPDALARMQQRLATLPRPLHALAIGASEPYKQWGEGNFVELASRLVARGHGVLLLGGPAEKALAQDILARIEPALRERVATLTDGSVADSIAAVSLARSCIGNDTGAVQFAAAVGTRAFVVLGPRPPLEHDPEHVHMLQAARLVDISAADVEASVLALLG
ncbi:glycosyltransferase family 9 protein [Roseateles saccharophilus]|uniref:Heptosyltransferase-2 n=1 Tax=Roseateles saccharophilus TaxID=304 RepID=A0A4R3V9A6_ROSSA|nr:glycosyltransferase family 9 protein [Roseateles saccharophilus]MDG0832557.1 lipopolysaccharide heptosyltransferase family protein [Roseateles saccharophilus]TCV00293.1 heptosyltransferase-2 [Roseateles saccharophilus]